MRSSESLEFCDPRFEGFPFRVFGFDFGFMGLAITELFVRQLQFPVQSDSQSAGGVII